MAEETESSLEDLARVGEGGCNPKDETKTLNGATTTTSTTVTVTTSATSTSRTTTTSTASSKKREHGITADGIGGAGGNDSDNQSKSTENSASTAGSSGGRGTRLRPRIYRPRPTESSSEDSDNETEIETSRRLGTNITISGGGGMAGRDIDSPVSTEPGQEEVEMEPASPEGMETAGGNTDIEATGDYMVMVLLEGLRVLYSKVFCFLNHVLFRGLDILKTYSFVYWVMMIYQK